MLVWFVKDIWFKILSLIKGKHDKKLTVSKLSSWALHGGPVKSAYSGSAGLCKSTMKFTSTVSDFNSAA